MLELIAYAVFIMFASLVGVFSIWRKAGRIIERNLNFLISFSAGVFIVIAYYLGAEATEHANTFGFGLAWILAGVFLFWFLFKILPFFHHHHDKNCEKETHSMLDARRILAGDAIHNIGDGVILAASFAVNSIFGALVALSIFIHELVQELSEFFVLRQVGYSTKQALTVNFAISGTILIGALGGFFLLESFEALEVPLLGLASGAFFVVVLHDLVPHSVRTSKREGIYFKHLLWFVIGAAMMVFVNLIVGH